MKKAYQTPTITSTRIHVSSQLMMTSPQDKIQKYEGGNAQGKIDPNNTWSGLFN